MEGGGNKPTAVVKVPAGHGQQSASDESVAPAVHHVDTAFDRREDSPVAAIDVQQKLMSRSAIKEHAL